MPLLNRTISGNIALILLATLCAYFLATLHNQQILAATIPPAQNKKSVHQMPSGKGATLIEANCQRCHTLRRILSTNRTRREWQKVLDRMRTTYRASLTSGESKIVLEYLTRNYGPAKKKPAKKSEAVAAKPESAGK